jgi:hypothetical protein
MRDMARTCGFKNQSINQEPVLPSPVRQCAEFEHSEFALATSPLSQLLNISRITV